MGILKSLFCFFLCCCSLRALAGTATIPAEQIDHLIATDGKPIVVGQKKKTLLYFWATWCPSCRQKFAHGDLDALNSDPNVEVITVNTDKELDRAKSFVEKSRPQVAVARDPSHLLTDDLKIVALPYWAVVEKAPDGKSWNVVAAQEGGDFDKIRRALGI